MAEIVMFGILLFASFFDWKTKKIPNRLIVIGLLPVLWTLVNKKDLQEFFWSVLSMALIFLLCWPFYLLRGLGAGDIKLFILLMGICGGERLLFIAAITFFLACVFSLANLVFAGDVGSFFRNRFHFLNAGFLGGCDVQEKKIAEKDTVILAPFIAFSYLLVMTEGWWR